MLVRPALHTQDGTVLNPNEFWLNVHRLASAYESEGRTSDERAKNIAEQFRQMPHVAQHEVLADLLRLSVHIPDLCATVVGVAHEGDGQEKVKPKLHSA